MELGGGQLSNRTTALLLTHDRPSLATRSVQMLRTDEMLSPEEIFVGVNGDPRPYAALESECTLIPLGANYGPAGGFARLFRIGLERTSSDFFYVCEDDICLLSLPTNRLPLLTATFDSFRETGLPIGGIAAYARTLDWKTGATTPHEPASDARFAFADAAAWGATLVDRRLLEGGVLPDERFFFALEDFDFWLSANSSGFKLVVDQTAERAVSEQVTQAGREVVFVDERPEDSSDAWRRFYEARNFWLMAVKHGYRRWLPYHLAKSVRRFQLSGDRKARRAIVLGLFDGLRGRSGIDARYLRKTGEFT